MFKIPAWASDIPKTDEDFTKKGRKNNKATKQSSTPAKPVEDVKQSNKNFKQQRKRAHSATIPENIPFKKKKDKVMFMDQSAPVDQKDGSNNIQKLKKSTTVSPFQINKNEKPLSHRSKKNRKKKAKAENGQATENVNKSPKLQKSVDASITKGSINKNKTAENDNVNKKKRKNKRKKANNTSNVEDGNVNKSPKAHKPVVNASVENRSVNGTNSGITEGQVNKKKRKNKHKKLNDTSNTIDRNIKKSPKIHNPANSTSVGKDSSEMTEGAKVNKKKRKNKHKLVNDTSNAVDGNIKSPTLHNTTNSVEKDSSKITEGATVNKKKRKNKHKNTNDTNNAEDSPKTSKSSGVLHKTIQKNPKDTQNIAKTFVNKMKLTEQNSKSNQNNPVPKHFHKNQAKKEKLKKMLEKNEIMRTPINVSGNKLRDRMLERLKSAQFRFLNEKLYTSSGTDSKELFQSNPEAFKTYHEGYQQQLKKWPINPLDVIVKKIQKMPKTSVIADMGCGEAGLSKRVSQKVHSFDLVAATEDVVACDMAHTPLLAESVDVAVYCLALMGTELTQYLVEANRILKTGGQLLIAEVESRFDDVNSFTKEVERLGFKLKSLDNEQSVFFFLHFAKVCGAPAKKSKLPSLNLKPCLYKKR